MPPVAKPLTTLRPTYLRQWRKHAGLTQEQVAEPFNMSAENYGKIERNLVPYDQRLLEKAAELYGCTPADLLMRDPKDPDGIWGLWQKAQNDQKRQIADIVKIIVSGRVAAE